MAEPDQTGDQTGDQAGDAGSSPLDQGGPGRTTLAPKVVERIAVAAAREVGSTTSARDGLTGVVRGRLPRASAVVAGQTSRVEVQVAASWPDPLAGVAARVRAHVTERIESLAGVDVTSVDVTVAEIVHERAEGPRVH